MARAGGACGRLPRRLRSRQAPFLRGLGLLAALAVAAAALDGETTRLLELPTGVGHGLGAICADQSYALLARTNSIFRYDFHTGALDPFSGDPAGSAGYGDGIGTAARFNGIKSIVLDDSCRFLFVADHYNHRVRRVNTATRQSTTYAGNGTVLVPHVSGNPAIFSPLSYPKALGFSLDYRLMYVGAAQQLLSIDTKSPSRTMTVEAGVYDTVPSSAPPMGDGAGAAANLDADAIVPLASDEVLFAEYLTGRVRRFHQPSTLQCALDLDLRWRSSRKLVSTAAGQFGQYATTVDGTGTNAILTQIRGGMAFDPYTQTVYISNKDTAAPGTPPTRIRRITFPGDPPVLTVSTVPLTPAPAPGRGLLPVNATLADGVLLDFARKRLLLTTDEGVYAVSFDVPVPARVALFSGGALTIEGGASICVGGAGAPC
eukprot:tig00000227_g19809.t1